MRTMTAEPRPPRARRLRGWLIALGVVLVVLFMSFRAMAVFYTDYLWFSSVGFSDTWRSLLAAKVGLGLVFFTTFFVLMYTSLTIADRLAPRTRPVPAVEDLASRYQATAARYSARIRLLVSAFFAIVVGGTVAGEWQQWVLFTHRVSFGRVDPQFNKDIGFYVFQLPFINFFLNWLFVALVVVLVATIVMHYLNGGIRLQGPTQSRVTPQVKAHVSVILAVMALVKTGQYWYARYNLNFSSRGVVSGASKTDVAAQLPALNLLVVISIVAAGLFVWNIRRRGWVLPVIAVGLWAFVALVVGTVFPAIYQSVRVNPNELQSEKPYIARNITATRDAFGLAKVGVTSYDYQEDLDAAKIVENSATVENARLWDPYETLRNYQSFQGLQTFYKFSDVDVDRYPIGGRPTQVMVSARELNRADLPSQSWVNRQLVYTHGFGAVASAANKATADGTPQYLLKDIPPNGDVALTQPRVYFGESTGGYVLVNAKSDEFDYPLRGQVDAYNRYEGDGGIKLDGFVRRLAFATRFNDYNLLISGQVTPKTQMVFNRDIRSRVEQATPFLTFDADPYPVILDGGIVWMLDGFTTSSYYPYSQPFFGEGGLGGQFNYVRNSVKVTVDAYTGVIKYYIVDPKDPIVRSWQQAFPDLFEPISAMPAGLRSHLRYPQDLFKAQTDVYRTYHMTDATTFYNKTDLWAVSPDPGSGEVGTTVLDSTPTTIAGQRPQAASSSGRRIDPIYLLIKLPGQDDVRFQLLRPFVPVSSGNALTNLVSFMVADSDEGSYGQLRSFVIPDGRSVYGPQQVDSTINTTQQISEQYSLLGRTGSRVIQGSMQLLPIADSILYIRPVYVQADTGQQLPSFRFVVAFYAGRAVIDTSLRGALGQLFEGGSAGGGTGGGGNGGGSGGGGSTDDPTVSELLARAAAAYDEAQAALKAGDLGRYQELTDEVGRLLKRAQEVAGSPGAAASTTTSTTRPAGATQQSALR
ncbi:MAG: UPF0182 family protein [Actinomycetes bacterium]